MILFSISNNKLFFRSIDIIRELLGVEEEVARRSLLKAIYETDLLTESILGATISHHLEIATPKPFSLPTAILIASGKFSSVAAAQLALKEEPVVRNIIRSYSNDERKMQRYT